jgi:hypothetical protein
VAALVIRRIGARDERRYWFAVVQPRRWGVRHRRAGGNGFPEIFSRLWIGVLRGLIFTSGFVASFDGFAVLEFGSGADEGDQVGALTARQRDGAASISL